MVTCKAGNQGGKSSWARSQRWQNQHQNKNCWDHQAQMLRCELCHLLIHGCTSRSCMSGLQTSRHRQPSLNLAARLQTRGAYIPALQEQLFGHSSSKIVGGELLSVNNFLQLLTKNLRIFMCDRPLLPSTQNLPLRTQSVASRGQMQPTDAKLVHLDMKLRGFQQWEASLPLSSQPRTQALLEHRPSQGPQFPRSDRWSLHRAAGRSPAYQ